MAKFLFDFDGVLTDQTEEARRVRALFREQLIRLTGAAETEVDARLERAEAAMDREPWRHGWLVKGRVAAFADEDLFIRNNGLAACFDEMASADDTLEGMRDALPAHGYADFCALAQFAYEEMARETKAGAHEPIDRAAPIVLRALLEQGHSLVVVSNSGTDRIVRILGKCGLDPRTHAEAPAARLRVRGGARKFELGDEAHSFTVDRYVIETARPVYEAIIREERPAAVIGDVFTLDLALPLQLTRSDPQAFGGMKIFLRTRRYTPGWSRHFVEHAPEKNAALFALDEIEKLPELLS